MKSLRIVLITAVVIAIAILAFLKYADKDTKRKVFEETGIQDSKFVEENAIETFIATTEINARQKLNGVWVISGWIRNTHKSQSISEVKIRFNFTDGSETEIFYKNLMPDGLGQPFRTKISGHKDGNYLGYDIIEAESE